MHQPHHTTPPNTDTQVSLSPPHLGMHWSFCVKLLPHFCSWENQGSLYRVRGIWAGPQRGGGVFWCKGLSPLCLHSKTGPISTESLAQLCEYLNTCLPLGREFLAGEVLLLSSFHPQHTVHAQPRTTGLSFSPGSNVFNQNSVERCKRDWWQNKRRERPHAGRCWWKPGLR